MAATIHRHDLAGWLWRSLFAAHLLVVARAITRPTARRRAAGGGWWSSFRHCSGWSLTCCGRTSISAPADQRLRAPRHHARPALDGGVAADSRAPAKPVFDLALPFGFNGRRRQPHQPAWRSNGVALMHRLSGANAAIDEPKISTGAARRPTSTSNIRVHMDDRDGAGGADAVAAASGAACSAG